MICRPRSSSSTSSASVFGSSPSLHHAGWAPAQATLSPAACTSTDDDYFVMKRSNSTDSNVSSAAASLRRDSTSSISSVASITFSSSPLSPSIAYPCWPAHDASIATAARDQRSIARATLPPPNQMPTSYITDDELASLDFSASSSRRSSSSSAEYDAGAQGISWSQTRQPCVPQHEERRRRLPPPPPGMVTVTCGKQRKSSSKERRRKALSMIKE